MRPPVRIGCRRRRTVASYGERLPFIDMTVCWPPGTTGIDLLRRFAAEFRTT